MRPSHFMDTSCRILALCLVLILPAAAEEGGGTLAIGAGLFDNTDPQTEAAMIEVDYRVDRVLYDSPIGKFMPAFGFLATNDETWFVYGALYINWPVGRYFMITPMVGPGYYEKGKGKDLGLELEFNNRIELSVALQEDTRLGVNFSHISNASFSSSNPGVNNLIFNVHFKF